MDSCAAAWFVEDQDVWEELIAQFFLSTGSHPADRWMPVDMNVPPRMSDVRLLHGFSQQTPVGPRKVAVLPWADRLRREVANSLLKLLEEPPPYLSVLVLSESSHVLPTIRSRVQRENRARNATVNTGTSTAVADSDFHQWKRVLQSLEPTVAEECQKAKDMLYITPLLHETVRHGLVREAFSKDTL